jgi:hypothetical protein
MSHMPELQTLLTGLAFDESPGWHDGRLWFPNWGCNGYMAHPFIKPAPCHFKRMEAAGASSYAGDRSPSLLRKVYTKQATTNPTVNLASPVYWFLCSS